MVLSGIIDDGTENIRIVLFRENAEKVLGMTTDHAKRIFMNKGAAGVIKNAPLGEEFMFEGSVKRNSFFDRAEFVANNVMQVDVKEEINALLG